MAQCSKPFQKEVEGIYYNLPCGKCFDCKARKVSSWSYRLMKEAERSTSAFFVTLTYDTDHVPITKNGYMSLHMPDIQNFFKKYRKLCENQIKYYVCGEYGGKTNRPHYHIILFNGDVEKIQEAWTQGTNYIGKCSVASVGYTLKYISKMGKIPMHKNDDRIKEFSLMSKKLGDNYITKNMVQWHKADLNNRMYCNLKDGKKIAMPRYYKEKIYEDSERYQISCQKKYEAEHQYDDLKGEKLYKKAKELELIRIEKQRKNKDNRNQII